MQKIKKMEHLWGKVGYIVQLSQMIEYNLANILALDELLREFKEADSMYLFEYNEYVERANKWYKKLEKNTFGFGLKRAKDVEFFNSEVQGRLEYICEERNFVVHRMFKEDLFFKHLESDPGFYYDRLEKLIEEMYQINENLNQIVTKQKEEFQSIR